MQEKTTPALCEGGGSESGGAPFFEGLFLAPNLVSFVRFLESVSATTFGGIFLLASFVLWLFDRTLPVDPAWVTIFVSGIPLVYLALKRLFLEKAISSALLIDMAMVASIYVGEIFAAGEVVFIMAIGAILEEKTVEKSKSGLRNLVLMAPSETRLVKGEGVDETAETVAVSTILPGDRLRALP
ncbi:MAG: hypothetical protein LBF41_04250, partial [Deltaproteobacteria bacterium]|nr:hypothetical protein [Deltaproteobacteria bacterium]